MAQWKLPYSKIDLSLDILSRISTSQLNFTEKSKLNKSYMSCLCFLKHLVRQHKVYQQITQFFDRENDLSIFV